MNKTTLLLLGGAVAVLLAACGGGSSEAPVVPPAATDAVPAAASESAAGMAGWLTELAAASADTKEPLDLATFNPKVSDTAEPETVK